MITKFLCCVFTVVLFLCLANLSSCAGNFSHCFPMIMIFLLSLYVYGPIAQFRLSIVERACTDGKSSALSACNLVNVRAWKKHSLVNNRRRTSPAQSPTSKAPQLRLKTEALFKFFFFNHLTNESCVGFDSGVFISLGCFSFPRHSRVSLMNL